MSGDNDIAYKIKVPTSKNHIAIRHTNAVGTKNAPVAQAKNIKDVVYPKKLVSLGMDTIDKLCDS